MSHDDWYGLDELGRGAASPFDAPVPVEAGVRGVARSRVARRQAVREAPAVSEPARTAFPAAWEERLRATEEKLDQLLCAARSLGKGMAAHDAAEAERAAALKSAGEERAAALEGLHEARSAALDELRADLDGLSEQFKARIAKTDYEEATLKRLSDELDQHRSGLYRKIVEPLISEVIDVHQDMSITVASYRRKAEEGALDGQAARIGRDLDEFRLMLGDILRNWNVEVWQPEPGEALEPLRCRAVRALPTDDAAKHRTVAEAMTCGYAFEGKILRPAQVVAFSYKPQPQPVEEASVESEPEPEPEADPNPTIEVEASEPEAAEPPLSSGEAAAAVAQALQDASGSPAALRNVPPAPPAPPAPRAAKAGDLRQSE